MKLRKPRSFHTQNEVDSEGSWAVSYGDMVTLLLTFFIIFFTTDKFHQEKNLKLDVLAKHVQMSRQMASIMDTGFYPDSKVKDQVQGRVYQDGTKVYIEFSGVSFFKSGKIDLTPPAKKALSTFYAKYAPYMGQYNLGIRAFTDTKKVRQNKAHKFKDNLELSALRSVAVMRQLESNGVPLHLMRLSGYGELRLTEAELEAIPTKERKPSSHLDLARTAVLIIEPKEEK